MRIWILFFMLAAPGPGATPVVVFPSHKVRAPKDCAHRLASVTLFPEVWPQFEKYGSFIQTMSQDPERHVYFFFSWDVITPFANPRALGWSLAPWLGESEVIHILKTTPRLNGERAAVSHSYSIHELRVHYHQISYTTVRVPRLFRLIHRVIYTIRAMENYHDEEPFAAPELDFSSLYGTAPLSVRLEQMVNSWTTVGSHEAEIKRQIKTYLNETRLREFDREDTAAFAKAMWPQFKDTLSKTVFVHETVLKLLEDEL